MCFFSFSHIFTYSIGPVPCNLQLTQINASYPVIITQEYNVTLENIKAVNNVWFACLKGFGYMWLQGCKLNQSLQIRSSHQLSSLQPTRVKLMACQHPAFARLAFFPPYILELKVARSIMGGIDSWTIKLRDYFIIENSARSAVYIYIYHKFASFMKRWLTNNMVVHYTVLYVLYMLRVIVLYSAGYHELLSWLLYFWC